MNVARDIAKLRTLLGGSTTREREISSEEFYAMFRRMTGTEPPRRLPRSTAPDLTLEGVCLVPAELPSQVEAWAWIRAVVDRPLLAKHVRREWELRFPFASCFEIVAAAFYGPHLSPERRGMPGDPLYPAAGERTWNELQSVIADCSAEGGPQCL